MNFFFFCKQVSNQNFLRTRSKGGDKKVEHDVDDLNVSDFDKLSK